METAEGAIVSTKLVGTLRLVLTNDKNGHHTYNIRDYIFDPESPINILGIPTLGKHFKDSANVHSPF